LKRNDSEARGVDRLRVRLATMSEVSRRVTQSWDLNTVLQEVVDGARSLTDARYGAVGVLDDGVVSRVTTCRVISLQN